MTEGSTKQLRHFAKLMADFNLLRLKVGDIELIRNPQGQAVKAAEPAKGQPTYESKKPLEELVSESQAFADFERTGRV